MSPFAGGGVMADANTSVPFDNGFRVSRWATARPVSQSLPPSSVLPQSGVFDSAHPSSISSQSGVFDSAHSPSTSSQSGVFDSAHTPISSPSRVVDPAHSSAPPQSRVVDPARSHPSSSSSQSRVVDPALIISSPLLPKSTSEIATKKLVDAIRRDRLGLNASTDVRLKSGTVEATRFMPTPSVAIRKDSKAASVSGVFDPAQNTQDAAASAQSVSHNIDSYSDSRRLTSRVVDPALKVGNNITYVGGPSGVADPASPSASGVVDSAKPRPYKAPPAIAKLNRPYASVVTGDSSGSNYDPSNPPIVKGPTHYVPTSQVAYRGSLYGGKGVGTSQSSQNRGSPYPVGRSSPLPKFGQGFQKQGGSPPPPPPPKQPSGPPAPSPPPQGGGNQTLFNMKWRAHVVELLDRFMLVFEWHNRVQRKDIIKRLPFDERWWRALDHILTICGRYKVVSGASDLFPLYWFCTDPDHKVEPPVMRPYDHSKNTTVCEEPLYIVSDSTLHKQAGQSKSLLPGFKQNHFWFLEGEVWAGAVCDDLAGLLKSRCDERIVKRDVHLRRGKEPVPRHAQTIVFWNPNDFVTNKKVITYNDNLPHSLTSLLEVCRKYSDELGSISFVVGGEAIKWNLTYEYDVWCSWCRQAIREQGFLVLSGAEFYRPLMMRDDNYHLATEGEILRAMPEFLEAIMQLQDGYWQLRHSLSFQNVLAQRANAAVNYLGEADEVFARGVSSCPEYDNLAPQRYSLSPFYRSLGADWLNWPLSDNTKLCITLSFEDNANVPDAAEMSQAEQITRAQAATARPGEYTISNISDQSPEARAFPDTNPRVDVPVDIVQRQMRQERKEVLARQSDPRTRRPLPSSSSVTPSASRADDFGERPVHPYEPDRFDATSVGTVTNLFSRTDEQTFSEVGVEDKRIVIVMGPYGSGTNVMVDYISNTFDVDVRPSSTFVSHKKSGIINLQNTLLWKHAIPVEELIFSESAVVILMIREPFSWIGSMSRSPYELHPSEGKRNKKQNWLAEPVQFKGESCLNVSADTTWSSAIELWKTYAYGYKTGAFRTSLAPGFPGHKNIVIVRYEDIVRAPIKVMEKLTTLGLRRLDVRIAPRTIETTRSGCNGSKI